jgi:tetratricopeptide (TPR) repeat protein
MYEMQSQEDKALDAIRKELQFHPGNETVYRAKAEIERRMGRLEDAVSTARQWLNIAPEDSDAVTALSALLAESKKSGDAVEPLRTALKSDPENLKLNLALVDALVRAGRKEEGLAAIAKLRHNFLDATSLNSMAWVLADSNVEPELARGLCLQAIEMMEDSLAKVTRARKGSPAAPSSPVRKPPSRTAA